MLNSETIDGFLCNSRWLDSVWNWEFFQPVWCIESFISVTNEHIFSVQAKIMAVTGYFVILNCFVSLAEGFCLSPFLLGTVCLSTLPCILPTNLTAWWNMYISFSVPLSDWVESLPLLAESDIYFTIPWRVEGWANLGAAVTACKPCPWLYIAVVGLDMTLQSCMLLLYCAVMIVDMHAVRLLTFMLAW